MDEETLLDVELHGYIDGHLDEDSMARVESYLRTHPEIASRVHAYRQQKHELRAFAQTVNVHAGDQRFALMERQLARRLKRPRHFGWRTVAAMAAVLTAGWGAHVAYLSLTASPGYADEIMQAHMLSASVPEEIASISPERLGRLFQRIGALQQLPDLAALGFRPIGAQLLPSDAGPVLHVPYRDERGTMVSYFLLNAHDVDEVPQHFLHRNGLTLVYWQHARSQYALAAPLDDATMRRIATLVDSGPRS